MNTQRATISYENPWLLSDDELSRHIPRQRRWVEQLHRECSLYLGHPCQEGKRRYAKYREQDAVLRALKAEAKHRGLQIDDR